MRIGKIGLSLSLPLFPCGGRGARAWECKWCSLPPRSVRAWPASRDKTAFFSGSFSTYIRFSCPICCPPPPPLPPSLVRRAPLSFHSRRNPHRRRRSSIVGIDPQMMTNAPFFRMKTALAKPATRPAVQGARSAFPLPSHSLCG